MNKQYADRDIVGQGDYYTRHVDAMTREGLHSKSDIAAELAHRDREVDLAGVAFKMMERRLKGCESKLDSEQAELTALRNLRDQMLEITEPTLMLSPRTWITLLQEAAKATKP